VEILTDTAFGLVFVICTVTLSLGSYMLARRFAGAGPYDRHKEMAGAMVTRIAAMHGLIIALVFAQEMSSYQRLETQTAAEASAIADVFNDAARYDAALLGPLQQDMREYPWGRGAAPAGCVTSPDRRPVRWRHAGGSTG